VSRDFLKHTWNYGDWNFFKQPYGTRIIGFEPIIYFWYTQ